MSLPKFEDGVKVDYYRLLSDAIRDGIHGTCRHYNDHHEIQVPEEIIESLEEQLHYNSTLMICEQFDFNDE